MQYLGTMPHWLQNNVRVWNPQKKTIDTLLWQGRGKTFKVFMKSSLGIAKNILL